jgi:hypothetical protein
VLFARDPSVSISIPSCYCLGISHYPVRTREKKGGWYAAPFYLGVSPDQRFGPERIRVKQIQMRLVGLRFLYMQVAERHSNNNFIKRYYEEAVKGKNGILLQPNTRGIVKYTFLNTDPDVDDKRTMRIERGIAEGRDIKSLL